MFIVPSPLRDDNNNNNNNNNNITMYHNYVLPTGTRHGRTVAKHIYHTHTHTPHLTHAPHTHTQSTQEDTSLNQQDNPRRQPNTPTYTSHKHKMNNGPQHPEEAQTNTTLSHTHRQQESHTTTPQTHQDIWIRIRYPHFPTKSAT